MKETLEVVNKMQADGIIGTYAIGGAVGATFYVDPGSTFDLDIFTFFKGVPANSLTPLKRIYEYLLPLGYKPQGEFLLIEGVQVQFLPADDRLYAEALLQAVETTYKEVKTWVMSQEHLMAIALRLGRKKDFVRLEKFLAIDTFDQSALDGILKRHDLTQKWESFMATQSANQ